MRPDGVVIVAPKGDLAAGVVQRVEDLLVQQLIAQAAVEAFDEGVLLGLAGIDVVPGDVVLVCPLQDGATGELGAVITDDAGSCGFRQNRTAISLSAGQPFQ